MFSRGASVGLAARQAQGYALMQTLLGRPQTIIRTYLHDKCLGGFETNLLL